MDNDEIERHPINVLTRTNYLPHWNQSPLGCFVWYPAAALCYVVDHISPLHWGFLINWFYFFWRSRIDSPTCRPLKEPSRTKKKPRRGPEKLHLVTMPDTMPRPRATRVRPSLSKKSSKLLSMAGFKEIQRRQNVTWEWSLIVVDKASI